MLARKDIRNVLLLSALCGLCAMVFAAPTVSAITPLPTPPPGANSYGLSATKVQPPPTQGATVTLPASGTAFTSSPVTVGGICPKDLLVEVYDNNVMVGAVMCTDGSFSIQVSLFSGQNDLTAKVYDAIGQTGPDSNTITVTYNNSTLGPFGELITLTSTYGRRAADVGTELSWPLLLSGGNGPYAFSISWGDATKNTLMSQALPGAVNISHTYTTAGVFKVTVQATDVHGATAFLTLVAVSNGAATENRDSVADVSSKNTVITTQKIVVLWIPAVVALLCMFPVYWFGRRSQLVSIRKKLERDVEKYRKDKIPPSAPPRPS